MADLGMNIDIQAKGASQAASDIDKVSKSAENLEKKAKSLGYFFDQQGRLRQANGRFAKSNDEVANSLRAMKQGLDSSSSGALRLNKALSDVNNTTENTSEVMGLARRAIIGLIGTQVISQAGQMADIMTNLRSQVRFVTGSYEEAAQVQAKLLAISNDTFANLEATTTLYTRTARAMDRYGKTQQEVLTFTEAINNAMRVGGVGATEQASALLQLSQSLGSGVLQGDEFRSISEAAPILLDVLAKNTGVAREELKQLGSEGKLTGEMLFNAISKSSEELKRQASTMAMTSAGAFTVLRNNALDLADEWLNQSGVMSTVSNSIKFVANNLDTALIPVLAVAAIAVARVSASVISASAAFGQGSVEAMRYQYTLASMTGASRAMSVSMVAGSQAVRLLSGAMALVGGPAGLAVLAAGGIATYALSTRDAKKSTQELENELLQLEERFKNLDKDGRAAALVQQNRNLKDLKKQYEELKIAIGHAQTAYYKLRFNGKNSAADDAAENITLMKGELSKLDQLIDQTTGTIEKLEVATNDSSDAMNGSRNAMSGAIKPSKEAAKALSDIEKEYRNLGLTVLEMKLYDFLDLGGSIQQFVQFKTMLEEINAHGDGKKKSGRGSDPFGDRLKSLSEELSKIQAQNEEIAKFGRESLYTSAQQLTLEFNNQSSALYKVSDAQKQLLMNQAAAVDGQRQLNEILMLGSEYTLGLDQMEFELSLVGKTASEIEKLTFVRDLENQVKAISIGMTQENIDLLRQEIEKIKQRKAAIDNKQTASDGDIFGGISDGFTRYTESIGTFREQFANITEATFGGLTDAIAGFASGADQSFSDMTRSVLQNISKMLIQMAIVNTMKMAFGGFSDGGAVGRPNLPGIGDIGGGIPYREYSSGGHTGAGGKFQAAGIVHKDEFVFNKEATGNLGIGLLDKLHSWGKNGAQGVFQIGSDAAIPYSVGDGVLQAASNAVGSSLFSPYGMSSNAPAAPSPPSIPSFATRNNAALYRSTMMPQQAASDNQSGDINLHVTIYQDGSADVDGNMSDRKLKVAINKLVDSRIKENKRSNGLLAGK